MNNGKNAWTLVVVAALGYFVDIYDLVLFNVVKKESLETLGLSGEILQQYDVSLFNWQMTGMLIGGLLWGILGDKKGRIQVLFGSILLYSLANLANAFVTDTTTYAICRVIAGIGLAGELGAGITLVLLLLRVGAFESGMFKSMKRQNLQKGNFFQLFSSKERAFKYIASVAIGLPIWFVVGVLINQSHVIAKFVGVTGGEVIVGDSVMWSYIGLSVGDLLSGALSQLLKSRKKVIYIYLNSMLV